MCVFLLLSGVNRYVPPDAHVRVHQIWMGDRADDAEAASYTAQDLTTIQRDIGRLAKYTFEMGGSGALLSLALSVPPWQALHELTPQELRETNVGSASSLAAIWPAPQTDRQPIAQISVPAVARDAAALAGLGSKPVQDRFAPDRTQTAEAQPPRSGVAPRP
jgi:hypothetical protein